MKKRSFVGLISIALTMVMLCSVFLSGCGLFGDDNNNTPTEYTIQYTDDVGTHTLTVTDGATYSLEIIPERTGYDFLGLFDAEVGGTRYVSANGSSLSPFTDKKNMVLFPQFVAKEYTVVLDYQGAAVTGQRSLTVKYDEKLPELPKTLSKEHSVFAGWYTEENCGGTQVADAYGLIPDKSTLNESLFDIEGADEYLYLYAGFNVETFKVTFNFGSGIPSEEIDVEYKTPISEVIPETRNSDGQAVLSWSKTSSGGQIFTGNITDDTVLYAVEWAPVIELDLNGGEGKNAVVAREGATVAIPTPVREKYKFLHWETMSGDETNITKMPANGAQLKAVWQAMLVFDENGGTEVKDISQEVGTAITLPTPEKEGFIFAGWYTADEEKYAASSMPSVSVKLKAGWYQAKNTKVIIKTADEQEARTSRMTFPGEECGPRADWRAEVDLSEYLPDDGASVHIELHLQMRNDQETDITEAGVYLYDEAVVSTSTFLTKLVDTVLSTSARSFVFNTNLTLRSNTLYLCYYSKKLDSNRPSSGWVGTYTYYGDIWFNLTYPDITNLYL